MTNVPRQRWKKENNKGISRMRFLKFLFSLFLFSTSLNAQTEKNVIHQSLLWTRYYNQLELNHRWSIHSEFDNRIFINSTVQNLVVIRVQGRYKISEQVELGSGFAYFNVATQDADMDSGFSKPEYRLQQDVTWKQSLGKINLNQRLQIEERFFQDFDTQGLKRGSTLAMRFRYRFQGGYTLWKKEKQFLKTLIYDEIMINAGSQIVENTFDQNRIYAGLQYGINSSVTIEMGYLNSFQQQKSGTDYYDRNIIRFSIYHKLKI